MIGNKHISIAKITLNLSVIFHVFMLGNCGDITVSYSPSSLRFGSADSLYSSELDDVIAASLGYTPDGLTWPGLTVTSAFKYPVASVVFGIKTEGFPIKIEGASYELKEDASLMESYNSVSSLIGARAERPVHFEKLNILSLTSHVDVAALPQTSSLSENNPIDMAFLQEMALLSTISDYLKVNSSRADNGQDIFFVNIDSFATLVKEYGADSLQVKEASELLRSSLEQALYRLRSLYDDRVVIFDALLSEERHVRRIREAMFADVKNDSVSYNLASVYSEDFPVVFNIILILSIILVVAIIGVTAAMGFMDPGRDSIIYRMTNPRMKKDQ